VEVRTFKSPDKNIIVKIISTGNYEQTGSESKIEIRTAKGKLLNSKSFLSKDHSHGQYIYHAEWTTDSKYFIFNSISSGGHQPGHFITYFWEENKLRELDPYVGIWVTSDFKLKSHDSITVYASARLPNGKFTDSLKKTVSLNQLVKK
ncbi:MAG: hypothetical protein WCE54_12170, partial [Ignavibacteriaceae bacterium]